MKNKIIEIIENQFNDGIVAYNTLTSETIDENEIINLIENSQSVKFTDGMLIIGESIFKLYYLSSIDFLNI